MRRSRPIATRLGVVALLALASRAALAQDFPGPDDTVVAYAFDEGGGTFVTDLSGNANDGVVRGPRFVKDEPFPSKTGRCLEFSAPNHAVDIAADATLDAPTALTLSAWIKPDSVDGVRYILWGSDDVYSLALRDGVLRFTIEGVVLDVPFDAAGRWTHVAGTYDGATMSTYVNGEPVATRAAARGQLGPLDFRKLVRVGNDETADLTGFDRDFGGRIDDVRIVARALSPAEVLEDLATRIGSVPGTPVAFEVDLAFPSVSAVSTTIPTAGGDVEVVANVRFDARGKLVVDGACTVDGAPAQVSGKAKLVRGEPTYVLKLKTSAPAAVVKIKGSPTSPTALVVYKGPRGKAKLPDHPVAVATDVENPIAAISLRAELSGNGRIGGTALISSDVAGITLTGTVTGSLRGDALALTVAVGPWKLTFSGTRVGAEFVGTLKLVIPPDRSKDTQFRIPDFTAE